MFAGGAEVLGGLLLLVPRTTMLGAMVCLADMVQVFSRNMTYDVPVKLFSFHLILLSLLLLMPDIRRLASFLVLNRAMGPSTQPQLFKTRRANRVALVSSTATALRSFKSSLLVSIASAFVRDIRWLWWLLVPPLNDVKPA